MRLRIAFDGRAHEVRVEGEPPELRVVLAGRTVPVNVRVRDETAEAEVEGRSIVLTFGGGVRIDGTPHAATVEWLEDDVGSEGDPQTVTVLPPMPGRVIRILVAPGAVVRRGAPLVVLEAMKMHNEIPAPISGLVRDVLVKEGDTVGATEALVRIVRDEAAAGSGHA